MLPIVGLLAKGAVTVTKGVALGAVAGIAIVVAVTTAELLKPVGDAIVNKVQGK